MERSRTLLAYHDLTVEAETSPSQELIDHMLSTVLGQPGIGFWISPPIYQPTTILKLSHEYTDPY